MNLNYLNHKFPCTDAERQIYKTFLLLPFIRAHWGNRWHPEHYPQTVSNMLARDNTYNTKLSWWWTTRVQLSSRERSQTRCSDRVHTWSAVVFWTAGWLRRYSSANVLIWTNNTETLYQYWWGMSLKPRIFVCVNELHEHEQYQEMHACGTGEDLRFWQVGALPPGSSAQCRYDAVRR